MPGPKKLWIFSSLRQQGGEGFPPRSEGRRPHSGREGGKPRTQSGPRAARRASATQGAGSAPPRLTAGPTSPGPATGARQNGIKHSRTEAAATPQTPQKRLTAGPTSPASSAPSWWRTPAPDGEAGGDKRGKISNLIYLFICLATEARAAGAWGGRRHNWSRSRHPHRQAGCSSCAAHRGPHQRAAQRPNSKQLQEQHQEPSPACTAHPLPPPAAQSGWGTGGAGCRPPGQTCGGGGGARGMRGSVRGGGHALGTARVRACQRHQTQHVCTMAPQHMALTGRCGSAPRPGAAHRRSGTASHPPVPAVPSQRAQGAA